MASAPSQHAWLATGPSCRTGQFFFFFLLLVFSWPFLFPYCATDLLSRRSHSNDDGIILLSEFQKFKTVNVKKERTTRTAELGQSFRIRQVPSPGPSVALQTCPAPVAPAWFLPASCRDTSCTTFLSPNINKVANNSTSKGQLAHPKPTGERGTLKEGGTRLMAQQESSPYLKRG